MLSSKMQEPASSHGHQHRSGFGHASQPAGTIEYVTSSRDTMRSIAVAFDTTTTRLMKLNRMSSLTIFPGQTLYVPSQTDEVQSLSPPSECEETNNSPPKPESWDHHFTGEFSFLSPLSPSTSNLPDRPFKDLVMVSAKSDAQSKIDSNSNEVDNNVDSTSERRKAFKASKGQGAVERNDLKRSISKNSDDRQRVMSGESTESEPFEEGFLKMEVRYLVSHTNEMVKGVMLVTPTALMFDPATEDPIVKRDGCDEYGIMCKMNRINSIAMYNDTTRMTPSPLSPIKSVSSRGEGVRSDSRSSMSSDTTTEAEAEINETVYNNEIPDLPLDEEPKSPPLTSTMDLHTEAPVELGASSQDSELQQPPGADSPMKSTWSPVHESTLYAVKGKVPGSAKPAAVSSQNDDASYARLTNGNVLINDNNYEADETKSKNDEFKLENEFPFLHAVVKTVGDLIPGYDNSRNEDHRLKPPRPDCNHMYLCIHSRQRMRKTFSLSEDDERDVESEDNSLQQSDKPPEYWFQVPRKRSDHLYAFFLQWSADNQADPASQLGFVVLDDELQHEEVNDANENKKRSRSHTNSSLEFVDDFFDESYPFEKEWEIISIQEAKRRSVAVDAIKLAEEDESLVPELEKPSNLLDEKTLLSLCKHLPNRCVGYSWSPIYTTYDHGTSLRTLYRNMANMDAPVVLIIQDSNENIFGALCSNSLHVSDHYYGTGESFLFTLKPNFEVFKWTGENSFFIKGDTDALAIGGGKGTFGLWLDGDLYRGCSHTCDTFRNKVLSSEEDFEIQSIEVWLIKDM